MLGLQNRLVARVHGCGKLLFQNCQEIIFPINFNFSFQREFSIFLSVEEYQIPDVRNGLFEQYLQRYLGYNEEKDRDDVDEKVTIFVYYETLNINDQQLDLLFD